MRHESSCRRATGRPAPVSAVTVTDASGSGLGGKGALRTGVMHIGVLAQRRQDALVPGAEGQALKDGGARVSEQAPVSRGTGRRVAGHPGADGRLAVRGELAEERLAQLRR